MRNRYLEALGKIEAISQENDIAEDPNYILVFTVCLVMAHIFTDLSTGNKEKVENGKKKTTTCYVFTFCKQICEYLRHPQIYCKN